MLWLLPAGHPLGTTAINFANFSARDLREPLLHQHLAEAERVDHDLVVVVFRLAHQQHRIRRGERR